MNNQEKKQFDIWAYEDGLPMWLIKQNRGPDGWECLTEDCRNIGTHWGNNMHHYLGNTSDVREAMKIINEHNELRRL